MNDKLWRALASWKSYAIYFVAVLLVCCGIGGLMGTGTSRFILFLIWGIGLVVLGIAKVRCSIAESTPKQEKAKVAVKEFDPDKDPIAWLNACDGSGAFSEEISELEQAYSRVAQREWLFQRYEKDSPFRKSYELVKAQTLSDIKSSGQFMATYIPSSKSSKQYLKQLVENAITLSAKLDKLVEAAISNASCADVVDTSYVDDLLQSLDDLRKQGIK